MDSSNEELDEIVIAPPTKNPEIVDKKKLSKSMKPASPPKAKKKAIKYDEESDGIMDYDDLPKGPPRSRVARGAPKKYVEVLSEGSEGSMFIDE